jgi:hypothetical protein
LPLGRLRAALAACQGNISDVVAGEGRPTKLATDGTSLYWMTVDVIDSSETHHAQGRVWTCVIASCAATRQVLAVQRFARDGMSMALDATHVYWVAQGQQEGLNGRFYPRATIYRHAK